MTQPTNYALYPNGGIDVTQQYNVSASITPETPAPPFQPGMPCFSNNGGEFVFVQASTSISLGDFVAITNAYQANSLTSTNIVASNVNRLGMASATLKGSVTYIPAGGYFWAQVRGAQAAGNANSITAATGTPVQLFTSSTAGAVSSVTTGGYGLAGIVCISSVEPYFDLSWPRITLVYSSTTGTTNAGNFGI